MINSTSIILWHNKKKKHAKFNICEYICKTNTAKIVISKNYHFYSTHLEASSRKEKDIFVNFVTSLTATYWNKY
jgi:serine kinase of HPr protein (carbohydrate metabolism regulator)